MSRKPESVFTAAIDRLLPTELHKEKMANPYRGGTADKWYSGNGGDLWVEYKFIPKLPVRIPYIIPDLSHLQLKWLNDRHKEGRNVAVVVGLGREGGVIYESGSWNNRITLDEFRHKLVSRQSIADFIIGHTM